MATYLKWYFIELNEDKCTSWSVFELGKQILFKVSSI